MDPFTLAVAGVGFLLSSTGAFGSMSATQKEASLASQEAGISRSMTALQGQENEQRQLAMQISGRRQKTETMRQTQLAMSRNLLAGAVQGGLGGESSGLAGGQAQARGQGAFNLLETNQNLAIGNTLFGIQGNITQDQMQMSNIQSQMATLQGQAAIYGALGSIGGSLMGAAGPSGKLLGNFFNNSADPSASTQGGMGLYSGAQTGNLY